MKYFLQIPAEWFHQTLTPALAECWRKWSFKPALALCEAVECPPTTFAPQGATFSRQRWRTLAGELMLAGAEELPQLETPMEAWAALLGQPLAEARTGYSPIQQAVLGGRDLWFGQAYRPEAAGWNDRADVARLADWLESVDPAQWRGDDLLHVAVDQRDDELDFAREWFPELRAMYRGAADAECVVVCEEN